MIVRNVNCQYFGAMKHPNIKYGHCYHPNRTKKLWFFRRICELMDDVSLKCEGQEIYPRPKMPPPPPPPKPGHSWEPVPPVPGQRNARIDKLISVCKKERLWMVADELEKIRKL